MQQRRAISAAQFISMRPVSALEGALLERAGQFVLGLWLIALGVAAVGVSALVG